MVICQVKNGAGRIYSCHQEFAFGRALGLVGILHRGFPRRLPTTTTTCTLSGSKEDQALDVMTFFNEYHVTSASLKLAV